MARASLLTVLLVGLCLAGQALGSGQRRRSQSSLQQQGDFSDAGQKQPQPFGANQQYTFTYNGQICTGLQQDTATAGESAQQKSATRLQAQAIIHFHSERHATLQLQQIRLGHLNERIAEPQQIQPMGMFQPKQMEEQQRRELQQPCAFTYEDGVVARINFHPEDDTWSKNIKRSVLNLLQLNLKRNNAQGLRLDQIAGQQISAESQQQQQQSGAQFTQVFTIPEINIEGECMTTYTINKANRQAQSESNENNADYEQQQGWAPQSVSCPNCFNVTKSIDFKQCSKIADVAYGYQQQQPQSQCAQCQQQWAQQQQQQQQSGSQQQQQQPNACDQCDPKEVKENKLERSTVQRFVLSGSPNGQYAIKRAELTSQYVYKNLGAEGGQYGASMQAVVAAELVFRGSKQQSPQGDSQQVKQLQQQKASIEREEQLLYSTDWDTEEKRFYMYGDEEFIRNSPFSKVTAKIEQAKGIIGKLVVAASNKGTGIEAEEIAQIQRLVELLRMCTGNELKELRNALLGEQQQQSGRSDAELQKIQHILGDALAMAGTRNTIESLVEQILSHQLSPAKAAQCLKALNGLPAPCDAQVAIVQRLCKNELVNRNPSLKQSCWLTFGAMVGELCQHKTQKHQQTPFGAQDEICPAHKQQIYKQTLLERYEQARTTYQKVLALKTIGNAGLDTAVPQLEQIINNKREQRVVRVQAIDALRRLRTPMARKIQRVLLPVFLNTREHPQLRMAAFSMIMQTQPEQPVVDQIAYTLTKERSQQVQAFVYTTMKALSQSKVPCPLAKHLKNALKLANIDESTLSGGSRKYQVPLYSAEEKEGLFLTLTGVVSSRSSLPAHLSMNIDSLINGEFEFSNLKVGMTQQGVEQWYEKVMQQLVQQAQQYVRQQQPTRGQRSQQGSSELRKIFNVLGIKSRQQPQSSTEQQQQQEQQNEQPFGMVNVRVGDVDQCVLAIDQQSLPAVIRQMLNGQKPSLRSIIESLEQQPQHFRLLTAQNLNEKSAKIVTSMGVPLRVLSAFPILAGVEGQIKLVSDSDRFESAGAQKLQLSIHSSVAVAHLQRMETWMPAIVTGVESVRCAEANLPLQADIQASRQKGLEVTIHPPPGKTRVLGLHTLPVTYHRDFDPKTKLMKAPRVQTIHNEELEQMSREVQKVVGAHALGMPFRVSGHTHVPSSPLCYKDIVQLLTATENQVHITYEPTPESTRTIRLSASGSAFQKVDSASFDAHRPQLKEFYSQSVKFEHAYPEDYSDMQLEDHNQRREKLNAFLANYEAQDKQLYKHALKLTVEGMGGAKRAKAQLEIQAACDAKLKYCKMFTTVERSPMAAGEQQPWQLKSKVQILSPECVSSVQQLGQMDKKHQKFICQAETQWGVVDSKKQFVNLRVQGEKVNKPIWQQSHIMRQQQGEGSGEQQALKAYQKKTAFLNKWDVVAQYSLQPQSQNGFSRAFEAIKANYFWATESQLNNQQLSDRSSAEGQVYATVVIDPIGQKHANISVKTPSQSVRMQQIALPTQIRPFPLVRQQSEQSTHSVGQMFQRLSGSNSGRAECKVDGKRVNTFDNVIYTAPISKCYSVLAKDCSSDSPQFSVLMKCIGQQCGNQQCGNQQSGCQQAKKIKVITQDQIIECQPNNADTQQQSVEEQPLKCTVNGREIGIQQQQQQQSGSFEMESPVEYDNAEKSACTITVPGVQVRFNGAKAWIKISAAFKNGQCGLCGHYDDQAGDEWRMPNNERASNIDAFHRSFSIQDNQECDQQEQDQFYQQNKGKFAVQSSEEFPGQSAGGAQRNNAYQNANSDEDYSSGADSDEQSWWGPSNKQQGRSQWKRQQGSGNSFGSQEDTVQPVKKTKVIEYSGMLCFSAQPVKQCPQGTAPASENGINGGSDYNDNVGDEQKQGGQQPGPKKVQFICLPRSSLEARRLQRQARQGMVVQAPGTPSFVENVQQPTNCVRY